MKISIITVCYNAETTLEETIISVMSQSYNNIEYIIIDGDSNDNTKNIISSYDSFIDKWLSEPDNGLYDAMNKGLRISTGDFVGFLNADDKFVCNDAIESVACIANKTDSVCILGDTALVDSKNTSRVIRFYSGNTFQPWQFRFGNMPPHPSTYVRRKYLLKLSGFDTSYSISADFDVMLRLFKTNIKTASLRKTLVAMRSGGLTTRGIKSNININRQIYRSCINNGIWTHPLIIWSKYFFKIFQYIRRPSDYP